MAKSKSAATFRQPPEEVLTGGVPDAPAMSPAEVAAEEQAKREVPPEPVPHAPEFTDLPESVVDSFRHHNHSVLDSRNGRWVLVVIGGHKSGAEVCEFPNREAGVQWVKEHNVPNVRIPSLGVG